MGRLETEAVRVVMKMNLKGMEERGRKRKRCSDKIQRYIRFVIVYVVDKDQDKRKSRTKVFIPNN